MEAVVFNNLNAMSSQSDGSFLENNLEAETGATGATFGRKLQNPAYPASHPANAPLHVQDFISNSMQNKKKATQVNPFDKLG